MGTAPRRVRAALLSAAVVAVPVGGALACARLGVRVLDDARTVAEPSLVLLALASLALAGVLAWAGAAAAAGVREAWGGAAAGPAAPGLTTAGPPTTGPHGRTRMVSAGVTALVVAALTAPSAAAVVPAATDCPPGRPGVATTPTAVPDPVSTDPVSTDPVSTDPVSTDPVSTDPVSTDPAADVTDDVAHDGVVTPTPPVVTDPLPGTWSALAVDGFRAPRSVPAATAALVTAQPTRTGAPAGTATAPVAEVVVVAGDSLWSIAARHLGPGADDTEVAHAWPRWWQANRAVVGDDPDLLLPGQRLVVPGP